jgi:ribosomal protein L40E
LSYTIEELLRRVPCGECELSLVCLGLYAYPEEQTVCRMCGRRRLRLKYGNKENDGRLWVTSETVVIEVTVDQALQAPCLAHLVVREVPKCQRCMDDEHDRKSKHTSQLGIQR